MLNILALLVRLLSRFPHEGLLSFQSLVACFQYCHTAASFILVVSLWCICVSSVLPFCYGRYSRRCLQKFRKVCCKIKFSWIFVVSWGLCHSSVLFQFLMPGYLGSMKQFKVTFLKAINACRSVNASAKEIQVCTDFFSIFILFHFHWSFSKLFWVRCPKRRNLCIFTKCLVISLLGGSETSLLNKKVRGKRILRVTKRKYRWS